MADEAKAQPDTRTCTCHPGDARPVPCAKQYALRQCQAVAVLRAIAAIPTVGSAWTRADGDSVEVRGFAIKDAKAYLPASIIDWARSAVALYDASIPPVSN